MPPAAGQIITRDLPPLTLRAAFSPATVKVDARTVDVVWSTGSRALRRFDAQMDIWKPFYEELSLDSKAVRLGRLNNGAPLLDGHPEKMVGDYRAVSVRGVVVAGSAKTNGKQGTATIRFAKAEDDPEADILFRKVQDGIVQHVSVGYKLFRAQQVGASTDTIPTFRVIDWEPFEISTVSIAEDDGAVFRGADLARTPCEFLPSPYALADADRGRGLRLHSQLFSKGY